jgi:hypothetical protein
MPREDTGPSRKAHGQHLGHWCFGTRGHGCDFQPALGFFTMTASAKKAGIKKRADTDGRTFDGFGFDLTLA